ncbi:MAG: GNAT family N-acetyltransferase [Candidatus Kariarchaeaceae archaeon]|jgi:GNAT superfamily N-acetyltransferase
MNFSGSKVKDFLEVLTKIYLNNPASVLPNALWKTKKLLQDKNVCFTCDNHTVKIWIKDKLYLYWSGESQPPSEIFLSNYTFALLHQNLAIDTNISSFQHQKLYFRMVHSHFEIPEVAIPKGFSIETVDIANEIASIRNTLNVSYGSNFSDESILSWTSHPTFDPYAWVWVRDAKQNLPVALGIAEFDKSIKELSLEWIQVLPEYRGMGFGKIIVCELIHRYAKKAKFSTVSGEINNPTNPEMLYKKCGFTGDDIWYVLQK